MIDLTKLSKEVIDAVRAATSLDELTQVQNRFLGKKSQIVKAKKELGSIPQDERATAGQKINEVRIQIETIVSERKIEIDKAQWDSQFENEAIDLTEMLLSLIHI